MTDTVLSRFLRYAGIDTQSADESQTYPSTAKQLNLLNLLVEEMVEMGVSDVEIDGYGYVTGRIPSNVAHDVPSIAFIAHVDTSPDVSGAHVSPRVVEYDGGDLGINEPLGLTIGADRLIDYVGHNLVVSDGTTLLGADDKAGVAEIMTAISYLIDNPHIEHGDVWVLFTPDEEVGRGVDHFDVSTFGARYAYTVDGGERGSLEWETFNAASAVVTVTGINYHPGYAKGKMCNSQYLAMQIAAAVPVDERPETTSDRQGFFHLIGIDGGVEQTQLHYIIRDHDRVRFDERKRQLGSIVASFNNVDGDYSVGSSCSSCGSCVVEFRDQYYNMGEVIKNHYMIVEIAEQAMREAGITPRIEPVRGGTDGSRLSFMGLPCANIFSGAENIHSRLEFVSEQVMSDSVRVVVNIIQLFCGKVLEN